MVQKRRIAKALGLGLGLVLLFGSMHVTWEAASSPSLGTVAEHSLRFGVAPVRADMGEGPGIPRFCQQVGAELLAAELGLGQAVSQGTCLAFFEARGQAAALS